MVRKRLGADPFGMDEVRKGVASLMLQRSLDNMDRPLSSRSEAAVRRALQAARNDTYGDGDQSTLPDPTYHPLRAAWSTGLDIIEAVLSPGAPPLHLAAFTGNAAKVRELLANALRQAAGPDGNADAVHHILEARISKLRLTPLHYACQGARVGISSSPDPETGDGVEVNFADVTQALLSAGARPNSTDIAGFTPLACAAGFYTSDTSLQLVPLLARFGADPNVRSRFGESLLSQPIMSHNVDAVRALLKIGARLDVADTTGLTPVKMMASSPELLAIAADVQREAAARANACAACSAPAAPKLCSACRGAHYCSRDCQRRHWRNGHREVCAQAADSNGVNRRANATSPEGSASESGRDRTSAGSSASATTSAPNEQQQKRFVDVVVGDMTSQSIIADGDSHMTFINSFTGAASSRRMHKPRRGQHERGQATWFIIKVSIPIDQQHDDQSMALCIKINVENSDFLLVSPLGVGKPAYEALARAAKEKGMGLSKVYLSAKWLDDCPKDTLRIDVSTALPAPAPIW